MMLHHEELCNLYMSLNVVKTAVCRRLQWTEHVARLRDIQNTCRMLMGNPLGERPFGRPKNRWEINIKIYIREIDCEDGKCM